MLKCKITVEKKEEADKASTIRSQELKDIENVDGVQDKPLNDKFTVVDQVNIKFPFNLHRKEFLDYINDSRDLKLRAYILQCHNLSAVNSYSDIKSKMAGYSANCYANPYVELLIGKGDNINGLVRYINDSKRAVKSTLHPRINQMYAMDTTLLDDYKLTINVKSKGNLVDTLIGSTKIDIEDRYYGDAYSKAKISLLLYKQYYKRRIDKEENAKRLKRKVEELNRLQTQIEGFEELRKIEFRQLMKEGKQQPQGTMQMWLDVFPADSRYPEYNLRYEQQNNYELRLVIWNIYNVPYPPGVNT